MAVHLNKVLHIHRDTVPKEDFPLYAPLYYIVIETIKFFSRYFVYLLELMPSLIRYVKLSDITLYQQSRLGLHTQIYGNTYNEMEYIIEYKYLEKVLKEVVKLTCKYNKKK